MQYLFGDFCRDRLALTLPGDPCDLLKSSRAALHGESAPDQLLLSGVDVVIDCTGAFRTEATLAPYFEEGIKKGVVSAPVKDGPTANIVYDVNHETYDPARHKTITAASSTTNCLAPVNKVIHETIGIKRLSIYTIHDATNTRTVVDRPAKNLRRARSALTSLIPTTTGSAAAEEVNTLFEAAAAGDLKGILAYETRPRVSCDDINDPRSASSMPRRPWWSMARI